MVSKKRRRRQLARAKWERQQARRALRRQRARRRAIIAGAVAGVLAVSAAGYGIVLLVRDEPPASAEPAATATPTPTPSASPKPQTAPRPTKPGECRFVSVKGDDQQSFGTPPAKAPLEDAVATIKTNRGTITVDLHGKAAPCAVQSFRFLADKQAYDGTRCTGLTVSPAPARYLECGDPTGSGTGGPGYIFGNENDAGRELGPGWLVMTGGENRNGSRFAITYAKSSFAEPVTVFGRVRKGLDVVREIARVGIVKPAERDKTESGATGVGKPVTSVIIQDVKVTPE